MTNKNENINHDLLNNEKEDNISKLETEATEKEASEQTETADTEAIEQLETETTEKADNSSDETIQNEDCGKLPPNQEDGMKEKAEKKDKKKKILPFLLLFVALAGCLGVGYAYSASSKDKKEAKQQETAKEETIDYMQYVQGIGDLELTSSKEKYDYLRDITFDKEIINNVTVDDSQVDLTKVGEYQLTYLIDVKDEKAEDLKQVVTVKVVSDDKKAEPKKNDDKKDNTSTSSKPSSDGSSTNGSNNTTTKPNNGGSSSSSNTNISKPSNSGSSNSSSSGSSNKKPASPTHTHRFVAEYKDIYHEEKGHYETVIVSEAWDEPIYEARAVCNCGAYLTNSELGTHMENHALNHENDAYSVQDVQVDTIHHPAKTEKKWVVDENGWTETVTTYKCSCGATK